MTPSLETLRAIWDLVDAETRRAQLWAAFPTMPLADAESIIHACRSDDREKGHRAFRAAVAAYSMKRAA